MTLIKPHKKDYFTTMDGQTKFTYKQVMTMLREGKNVNLTTANYTDCNLKYKTMMAFNDLAQGRAMLGQDTSELVTFIKNLGEFLGEDIIDQIIDCGGSEQYKMRQQNGVTFDHNV